MTVEILPLDAGIRTRLLEATGDGIWRVRFFPTGISGGVELWALPSSFMNSDGSKPSKVMVPDVCWVSPAIIFRSVDLPQPLGPTNETNSLG